METYKTARQKLVNVDFIGQQRYKEQQTRADRTCAHPLLLEFEKAFINKAKKMGIPLFTHCLRRTNEEQTKLYVKGRSKARAGQSPHNYAMAVDIIHGVQAWNIPPQSWRILGHIGHETAVQKGIDIVWGGDWKFFDPAHWELGNWRDLKQYYSDDDPWFDGVGTLRR